MSPDQLTLLGDTRLSREARIMGLYVAGLGDGPHQVAHESFRVLLGRGPRGLAKDDTLAGYVQELVSYGWLERKPGGQGSPIYLFTPPQRGGNPEALPPLESFPPPPWGTKEGVSPPTMGGQSAPSSSSTEPPPPPLDARASEFVLEAIALKGCRDSLLDYLEERVEPDRQLAYAQTVVGMVEGTDERLWRGRSGQDRITDGRAKIIAGCLNELRQGDEVGKYFPGAPGDVRNLQSKIRYKVKAETDAQRDAERRGEGAAAPGGARAQPRGRTPTTPEVRIER